MSTRWPFLPPRPDSIRNRLVFALDVESLAPGSSLQLTTIGADGSEVTIVWDGSEPLTLTGDGSLGVVSGRVVATLTHACTSAACASAPG